MTYLVAWSINHGQNNITDHWIVAETLEEAQASYEHALTLDRLHCAAVAQISAATDPHWLESDQ